MAPIVAVASLLYEGYQGIAANQRSQAAKGQASTLLDTQTKMANDAAASANSAASTAAAVTAKRAKSAGGASSTILTSPRGEAPVNPTAGQKTLLGV